LKPINSPHSAVNSLHNRKPETCEATGVGCRVSGEGSQAQLET